MQIETSRRQNYKNGNSNIQKKRKSALPNVPIDSIVSLKTSFPAQISWLLLVYGISKLGEIYELFPLDRNFFHQRKSFWKFAKCKLIDETRWGNYYFLPGVIFNIESAETPQSRPGEYQQGNQRSFQALSEALIAWKLVQADRMTSSGVAARIITFIFFDFWPLVSPQNPDVAITRRKSLINSASVKYIRFENILSKAEPIKKFQRVNNIVKSDNLYHPRSSIMPIYLPFWKMYNRK